MIAGNVGCTSAVALSARLGFHGHGPGGDRAPGSEILCACKPLFLQSDDFGDLNILSFANLNVGEQTRSEDHLSQQ
jgi:hypothetical protein